MIRLKVKNIIIFSILTILFGVGVSAFAVTQKPVLRDTKPTQMKLEGDIQFTRTNPKITLSLRDSDVQQVLRMFADKAGLNIMFHNSVPKDKKITLDLVNVPLNDAFKLVLQVSELTYYIENKTMIVANAKDAKDLTYSRHTMTSLPVKHLDAALIANFLNKNIFNQNLPGLSTGDIVTTNPLDNELLIFGTKNDVLMAQKILDKFDKKPKSTTFVLNHTTPKEMADLICKILVPTTFGSKSGGTGGASDIFNGKMTGGAGGISGGSDGGSAAIKLGEGFVACEIKNDVKAGNFSSFPTQSLTVSYYPQIGTINVIGGNDNQIETIREFVEEHDKKQLMAYLEIAIVESSENGSKQLTNQWAYANGKTMVTMNGGFATTILLRGNVPLLDPSRVLGNYPTTIEWAVNYLLSNTKGKLLSNPRILVTNGQTSTIDLTEDYIKKVTTDSATNSTTTGSYKLSKNYEIGDDKGLKFTITPQISPEGYVTFNINPTYTVVAGQLGEGDDVEATLLARRNLDLKNIRVKDGDTLILGGLVNEQETKGISKIPVLGDIPVIGFLFRSSNLSRSKSEFIVMVTPRIIFDEEDIETYKKIPKTRRSSEL